MNPKQIKEQEADEAIERMRETFNDDGFAAFDEEFIEANSRGLDMPEISDPIIRGAMAFLASGSGC